MVYFYQLFLNTGDVILKLYTRLCQKAKCTLFGALYMYLITSVFKCFYILTQNFMLICAVVGSLTHYL